MGFSASQLRPLKLFLTSSHAQATRSPLSRYTKMRAAREAATWAVGAMENASKSLIRPALLRRVLLWHCPWLSLRRCLSCERTISLQPARIIAGGGSGAIYLFL